MTYLSPTVNSFESVSHRLFQLCI